MTDFSKGLRGAGKQSPGGGRIPSMSGDPFTTPQLTPNDTPRTACRTGRAATPPVITGGRLTLLLEMAEPDQKLGATGALSPLPSPPCRA